MLFDEVVPRQPALGQGAAEGAGGVAARDEVADVLGEVQPGVEVEEEGGECRDEEDGRCCGGVSGWGWVGAGGGTY